MILRTTITGVALASLAQAAQPGSAKPIAAPMRDLKWGQLNFLHTTDTHGWLGGHLQEPQYSADWGDYVSFTQHMRKKADDSGSDLLLVDTGDRVEGNGLYDSSKPKGLYQYDIYAQAKVDLISVGNHELYKAYSADCEHNTTVPNFKENYIASNLDYVDHETGKREPMAQRYRKFKTKNQGIEIVAFGFIFNFKGNANNTVVQTVEETIKEEWFQKAIHEKPDLFVVIGHVGIRTEEYKNIYTAIRKQNWHIPIAFFGGHFHIRDALAFDSNAFAMASGRYFESIGFMSIDGVKPTGEVEATAAASFSRRYIDTNLLGLYHHTGLNETTFPTKEGKKVTGMITHARTALGLDKRFGCAPKDLWMTRTPYPSKDNIYTWITDEVFPGIITREDRKNKPTLAITNTGGIRFDIFKGPFTRDTIYAVNPFPSNFRFIRDVPYKNARKVIEILNSGGTIFAEQASDVSDVRFLAIPQQRFPAPAAVFADDEEEEEQVRLELRGIDEIKPNLIAGYTTKDDIGDDGDDTIHEKIKVYRQPNAIQGNISFPQEGEPDTVDLVFLDFTQPWILAALKFAGFDSNKDNVEVYKKESFVYMIGQWINKNWKGDC